MVLSSYLVATSGGKGAVYRVKRHRVDGEDLVTLAVALKSVLVFLRLLQRKVIKKQKKNGNVASSGRLSHKNLHNSPIPSTRAAQFAFDTRY